MLIRFFKGLSLLVFCVPTLVFAATKKQPQPEKTITLGVLYNLTGDQAPLDRASLRGAELAVAAINAQGGIKKHKLLLQIENGQSKPKVLQREAEKLAKESKIQVVIGLSDNNMVMAAAPPIVKAKKVFISSGATAPSLTLTIPDNLYLVAFGDNAQAAAGAEYAINTLHIKKATILYDKDMEYTRTLASYFANAFVRNGGVVEVVKRFSQDKFNKDDIKTLKSEKDQPRLIYLAAGPEEAPFIGSASFLLM
ncbi:ABC transporter substrate-binding protein [Candidiatus Paracoxiella cheracis]|uniref:ABC transporter substrate-binding protein n=1 Tax=Candidiatus Paracoxiella cheracis TaxID=3405120 RepID=UPI003BF5EB6F